jgi:glycosyltransferase involved in cell wall biosynthesis
LEEISKTGTKVLCIALGEMAPPKRIRDVEIRFVPFQRDPNQVARYYQAADIYVHPMRSETFPTIYTDLEAPAFGIPVVERRTGFLAPQENTERIVIRILQLLEDN